MTLSCSDRTQRIAALCAFLLLLVASNAWEMRALRREGELRLQRDAQSLAGRVALYLPATVWDMDAVNARAVVFNEMDDPRVDAVLIHDREGLLEGMRRNDRGEPVPWDDLMPENTVEAEAPVLMEDRPIGRVTVRLSRRTTEEELSAASQRALARTAALAFLPCVFLAASLRRLALPDGECRTVPQPEQRESPAKREIPPDDLCRAFLRKRQKDADALYRPAAREDRAELAALAGALREDALRLTAGEAFVPEATRLAETALALLEAARLGAPVAGRTEACAESLTRLLRALDTASARRPPESA
jgi:hypothetical protein